MSFLSLLICFLLPTLSRADEPLRIAVISLTHTHVHWIFNSEKRGDINIVGVVEPDTALAGKYARQYNFPRHKLFRTTAEMLARVKPEARPSSRKFRTVSGEAHSCRNFRQA